MKTTALQLIAKFCSDDVNNYSLNLYYNHSLTDDDTEFEAIEGIILTFRETNSPMNIGISIEIPFSMNILYTTDSFILNLNSGTILNLIKDHFELTIPLLLNEDYIGLSKLLRLIY